MRLVGKGWQASADGSSYTSLERYVFAALSVPTLRACLCATPLAELPFIAGRPSALGTYPLVGAKHKSVLRAAHEFHTRSRKREAAPRIHPNSQISPTRSAPKASLHPQTG